MGFVQQAPRDVTLNTRQADVEAGREPIRTVRQAQVNLRVDRYLRRERHFRFMGHEFYRAEEADRPPGRERLLGVGAIARRSTPR
jgi:hypothetical protein